MTHEEFLAEYVRLGHAVQSGIAFGPVVVSPEYKHLRTGLNLVMRDLGSLTELLVKKGVITEDEYFEAILAGVAKEVSKLEAELTEQYGSPVRLA